ncbi:MAG TPA: 6-phosphogluconolactonase [Chthoniobacterales bacterium]|nr:6-phosphogluconolactonase [Chthoniobacterales bacterium]
MEREVIRSRNFVAEAAQFILGCAREALAERGQFRIALSGGNTPRPVYAELARIGRELPWDDVVFTFGDERCVPPDDSQSNYRMARQSLFDPAAIPQNSVMRIRGEIDPHLAAQEYEDGLDLLATQKGEVIYRHDLILLGMGEDGHTASLFPETAALEEEMRKVMANFVAKLNAWRVTFTFPLISQARQICFLANANKNAALLADVFEGDERYPAARVAPGNGRLTWILAES